jgi:hypothetical protein
MGSDSGAISVTDDRKGMDANNPINARHARDTRDAVSTKFNLSGPSPLHPPDEFAMRSPAPPVLLEGSSARTSHGVPAAATVAAEIQPLLVGSRWVVAPPHQLETAGDPDETILFDGDTLCTLLAVHSGRRTVTEIAGRRGLTQTAHALARLRELGLVRTEALPAA